MKKNYRNLRYFLTAGVILTAVIFTGFVITEPNNLAAISKENSISNLSNLFGFFEENQGQFNEKVRYFARGTNGYSLFLTATDAVYVLQDSATARRDDGVIDRISNPKPQTPNPKSVAVYMTLAGANPNADFAGAEILEHKTNYFKGAESDWRTNISNYGQVRANGIYEGIDMVWYGKRQSGVRYDFVISPNANPDQIEWEIKGAKNVEKTTEGDLIIKTEYGEIRQNKPFTFQEIDGLKTEVESGFALSKTSASNAEPFRVKFSLGNYDHSKSLTIDPSVNLSRVAFSTLIGGPINDQGNAIALDSARNIYVTGKVPSPTFPTTPGTFDTTHNGMDDIFLAKLNATGSTLLYSTFIGGSDEDISTGIAIDSSGNAFLTGLTVDGATDFPLTAGTFDTTPNGGQDIFVTKLNATGSALIFSTLIGGSGDELANDLAIDSAGNSFLMGGTLSANYPTTAGAFDTTYNGSGDVFAAKLNADGSSLIYSTFVGGSDFDHGNGIAVDSTGNAYLTGYAFIAQTPYPTTPGALDTTHNGFDDVFVTKLNPAGSALIYSTFIGGLGSDRGISIAVDLAGNTFLTGHTLDSTTDFPVTAGAFDSTHNGGEDVFATKLNAAGSALIYSTFLGGSGNDQGHAIVVDPAGNAHLMGFTDDAATDYPTTAGAFNPTNNGSIDVFFTKLNSSGSMLTYSSFIGGSGVDRGTGIVLDSFGNTYLAGLTLDASTDYPTTNGAFDTTHNGGADVFVTKFSGASRSFDYDGDGKTDISIFRPSVGEWWFLRSSDGGNGAVQFGVSSDKLVPADYTGDGKTDVAIWRPATGEWFVLRSEDFSYFAFPFGLNGDTPVPADYDADGKADAAIFRASTQTWYIHNATTGGTNIITFGASADKPVVADYDGDGKADIAVYRANGGVSEWWIQRSSNGSVFAAQFGNSTDKAVQGDYTGDGKADIAVWRPASGDWLVLRSEDFSYFSFIFGASNDLPVHGDYDGDGIFDAGVFRPSNSTWYVRRSTAGVLIQQFGISGDLPTPNAFVP
jgi:hypothetical protein